ncbi:portal protein [Clostridia bacterium]|nr:portal protein [Clostridia bacterium]
MGIFHNLFHPRDKPKNNLGGYGFIFGDTTSGKNVNERTAMQVSAVYACVRILAEAIAGLPLHVYQYTADGGKERVPEHPLFTILHDAPNPEMTSFVFRETLMSHLLLWGNAYAQIIRNGRGQVTALYPLLPNRMSVDRIDGEIVYTYQSDSGAAKLSRENVLHIPGLGFDGIVGYSPIAMAKNSVGLAMAVEEFGATFFANGASPGGVLEHPAVVKDIERLKESWNAQYQGSDKAHKICVLEEGMQFKTIGIPPEAAQFLETRRFQIEEIARLYRIPLHLVGDLTHATFSNIEHQSLSFVKFTLDPWVVRLEQSMQQSLISPSERSKVFIKFNLEGLLRGAYKERMDAYAVGIQNGIYSINEVRSIEDLSLLSDEEGGNIHVLNGNVVKLSDAGAAYNSKEGEK